MTKQAGVTFIEALLQLIVFVVFCQLIGLIFLVIFQVTEFKSKRVELEWEIAVADINQYVMNAIVGVTPDGYSIYLQGVLEGEVTRITYLNQALVYRKNAGMETIVAGVKHAEFHLQDNRLRVEVVLETGEKRERIFFVESSAK